jgi:hypothetical protein
LPISRQLTYSPNEELHCTLRRLLIGQLQPSLPKLPSDLHPHITRHLYFTSVQHHCFTNLRESRLLAFKGKPNVATRHTSLNRRDWNGFSSTGDKSFEIYSESVTAISIESYIESTYNFLPSCHPTTPRRSEGLLRSKHSEHSALRINCNCMQREGYLHSQRKERSSQVC